MTVGSALRLAKARRRKDIVSDNFSLAIVVFSFDYGAKLALVSIASKFLGSKNVYQIEFCENVRYCKTGHYKSDKF